jgi:hypothetical protein
MAIYASSSTITAQTVPSIKLDRSTLTDDQVLQWNTAQGNFINSNLSIGGNPAVTSFQAGDGATGTSLIGARTGAGNHTQIIKTLKVGANLEITGTGTDVTIGLANGGALLNTGGNVGTGQEVYKSTVANVLQFRTLTATGSNLAITTNGNEIEFNNTAEINTASNLGTGQSVFNAKTVADLAFNSIDVTGQLSVSTANNTITIAPNYGFAAGDEGELVQVNGGALGTLTTGATGSFLMSGAGGLEWSTTTANTRKFKVTFETDGSLEAFSEVPADLTVTRIGNELTIAHSFNDWPKSVTYFGFDNTNQQYKLRYPTGNYQVLLDVGTYTSKFKIQLISSVAGADVNQHAYVNLVF